MIKAYEARMAAKEYFNGMGKSAFGKMREDIELGIMSESDSGHRSTVFRNTEFEDTTGIEFIVDELRTNGFNVSVTLDHNYNFNFMRVSW